ncbi:MAG: polysaccharide biosynthesis/export family protein [Pseudomonadota bacterium]
MACKSLRQRQIVSGDGATAKSARSAFVRAASVSLCAAILAGCTALPRSGPDDRLIANSATARLADETGNAPTYEYAAVDITKQILPFLSVDRPSSIFSTFGGGRGPSPELLIGVGDIIQITVFESQGGGLFVPDDEGSARTGNFVTFPSQRVDRRGFITVPYAGQVRALGRSLPDIEADIVSRIIDKAIEPQVTISLVERNASNATVVGDVNSPQRLVITESGDRVLDLIARSGGIQFEDYETFVTLTRRGQSGTVYYPNLIGSTRENIFTAPGDTIYVNREQRRFSAFGASGLTGEFEFDRERLFLTEAVAKAGGLLDTRADPAQVLLYRRESKSALDRMGVDFSDFSHTHQTVPTIYRINFRKPDAYFVSSKFEMRDGDVIYVSNSDSVELVKFLDIISIVTSTTAGVTGDLNAIKQNVHALPQKVD